MYFEGEKNVPLSINHPSVPQRGPRQKRWDKKIVWVHTRTLIGKSHQRSKFFSSGGNGKWNFPKVNMYSQYLVVDLAASAVYRLRV